MRCKSDECIRQVVQKQKWIDDRIANMLKTFNCWCDLVNLIIIVILPCLSLLRSKDSSDGQSLIPYSSIRSISGNRWD